MKTNSFYGFTDSIKQPRKQKVENTLDKLVRDNTNTVYRYADFIVNKIFEGFNIPSIHTITHGMINTRYGKEYGELTTPKIQKYQHRFVWIHSALFLILLYAFRHCFE